MALFGTDGIRARAGEGPLAPEFLRRLGAAIGTILKRNPKALHPPVSPDLRRTLRLPSGTGRRIVIGRDTRASGPGIERDLLRHLGAPAIRVGVIPTPGIAYLTWKWKAALGIVISASHNPAADNGIKVISGLGFKIPDEAELEIERLVGSADLRMPKRVAGTRRGAKDYRDFLRSQLPPGKPLRGRRIVVDCAHGAASAFAGPLLRSAGAEVTVLNARPDGRNINAGAGALHPERLAAAVRKAKADLGAAYDGDADRCILVDETGQVRDGDYVLAICADHMLRDGRLGPRVVVSTVMANFGLERFLKDRGVELRRVKVGDRFVAEEMMRTGARLGGEQSGHILFLDAATAGDGMLTTLRVLRVLLETGRTMSDLCRGMEKMPQVLRNVPVREKPDLDGVGPLRKVREEVEASLDGTGRVLLRYSGTEPLCRVMVEGADPARVRAAADRLEKAVRETIGA